MTDLQDWTADLSTEFLEFVKTLGIDPAIYQRVRSQQSTNAHVPHRYFLLNPKSKRPPTIEELAISLKTDVKNVGFCPGFYCIDGSTKLVTSSYYQQGVIHGMDISSALAVKALEIHPNDHVLDLCCAPGAKLVYIALILESMNSSGDLRKSGSVTGVDISKNRLATCRALIRKFGLYSSRLFCDDGRTFAVGAPSMNFGGVPNADADIQLKPYHISKLLNQDPLNRDKLYDKVIVDAECSHDGSIVHLIKYATTWGWDKFKEQFLDKNKMETLKVLQRQLLWNGFQLLKPGGILVYSTCSFSPKQNEDVILWFLNQAGDSVVLENIDLSVQSISSTKFTVTDPLLDELSRSKEHRTELCEQYEMIQRYTKRFDADYIQDEQGNKWWTSGFFAAKFQKTSIKY